MHAGRESQNLVPTLFCSGGEVPDAVAGPVALEASGLQGLQSAPSAFPKTPHPCESDRAGRSCPRRAARRASRFWMVAPNEVAADAHSCPAGSRFYPQVPVADYRRRARTDCEGGPYILSLAILSIFANLHKIDIY